MNQSASLRKFGTAPVFFTAISTILGAVMFLRFGFAVGNVGLMGTILLIFIGHLVTIPTAMAIAEIATNQKVEGGGEYYIISRSFGLVIGSAIGIALYLSQAISVAFYIMAFTEAFGSLFEYITNSFSLPEWLVWLLQQKQTIGIPALLLLTYVVLTKGADLGVKVLYVVVVILALSILSFFAGSPIVDQIATTDVVPGSIKPLQAASQDTALLSGPLLDRLLESDSAGYTSSISSNDLAETPETVPPLLPIGFFTIFAIIFPAFTGMTAGVGLSGDLRNPGRSIPLGTLAATIGGMVVYVLIAWKLSISASPQDLANTDRLVLADIAWQGWLIIPLGLAAATISSALGSILVAPRTLQAIARDYIFPTPKVNAWLSKGKGKNDEPYNASLITIMIAGVFVMAGALDSVAQVISMFFMVTYGSLCLISFFSHFAADPSYRPRFKSRWWISLFGALACFGLMFFMDAANAFLAVVMMVLLYFIIAFFNPDKKSMALMFQGVIFQFSRQMQVFLQKADKEKSSSWRPSAIAFSAHTFQRLGAFDLLRWISQKYGFGTYIHQINGYLSKENNIRAKDCKDRLIRMAEISNSKVYVDTVISPSYTSSVAQVIQLPGIAGTENNLLLFEYSKNQPDSLNDIVGNFSLIKSVDFDVIILGSSERGFGLKKEVHIWITANDYANATLMILLAYIIIGHKEWKGAEIKIFALYPEGTMKEDSNRLLNLIEMGQLPISSKNVSLISRTNDKSTTTIIDEKSRDADLTILGFHTEHVKNKGLEVFLRFANIGNVLFVNSSDSKEIK